MMQSSLKEPEKLSVAPSAACEAAAPDTGAPTDAAGEQSSATTCATGSSTCTSSLSTSSPEKPPLGVDLLASSTMDDPAAANNSGGGAPVRITMSDGRIKTPTNADVLLGRGKPYQNHPGNRRMLEIVQKYKHKYTGMKREKRHAFADKVLDKVLEGGNHFLKKQEGAAYWEPVPRDIAFDKVSHALRNKKAEKKATALKLGLLHHHASPLGGGGGISSAPMSMNALMAQGLGGGGAGVSNNTMMAERLAMLGAANQHQHQHQHQFQGMQGNPAAGLPTMVPMGLGAMTPVALFPTAAVASQGALFQPFGLQVQQPSFYNRMALERMALQEEAMNIMLQQRQMQQNNQNNQVQQQMQQQQMQQQIMQQGGQNNNNNNNMMFQSFGNVGQDFGMSANQHQPQPQLTPSTMTSNHHVVK